MQPAIGYQMLLIDTLISMISISNDSIQKYTEQNTSLTPFANSLLKGVSNPKKVCCPAKFALPFIKSHSQVLRVLGGGTSI